MLKTENCLAVSIIFYTFAKNLNDMRYCGSKARYAKDLIPIITEHLNGDNIFFDSFMGGANILSSVDYHQKMGIDINKYIVDLWKYISIHRMIGIPSSMERETYYEIKKSYIEKNDNYPSWLIGYTGSALSFGGAWFNGFSGYNVKKKEDHVLGAYNGLKKQVDNFLYLDKTIFINEFYSNVPYPVGSVIYCDPPYASTKKYISDFNNDMFWDWVRMMVKEKKCYVYVSEYEAPSDFKCVWEKEKKECMNSAKRGYGKLMTEKLFILK